MRLQCYLSNPIFTRKFNKFPGGFEEVKSFNQQTRFWGISTNSEIFILFIYVVAHQMLFPLFVQSSSWSSQKREKENVSGESSKLMCIFGVIMTSLPLRRQSGASFKKFFLVSGERGNLDLCVFYGFLRVVWGFEGFENSHKFTHAHFPSVFASTFGMKILDNNEEGGAVGVEWEIRYDYNDLRQSCFHSNFPANFQLQMENCPENRQKHWTDEKSCLCNHHVMHNKRFHFLYLDFTFSQIIIW